MRLASFIDTNTPQIMREWENFALTLIPSTQNNSPLALRDHIRSMLAFIADDIESDQSDAEQKSKSRGEAPPSFKDTAAEVHASVRLAGGFNMDQMVAEFRTLRASVIRLWDIDRTETSRVDIADLIRFNEAIDQEMTEAIRHYTRKLDHSRELFLGILSNDICTPVGIARIAAELTLQMGGLNPRQTMLMKQVTESTDRVMEIVTDLLDLTRARLGSGLPIVREDVDMGLVARILTDEMRNIHPERRIDLEVKGNTEGEWDKPRIGQVFSNLLGNAIQYSDAERPITVTVDGGEDEVTLAVHNHGVPIPPQQISRIFDSLTHVQGKTSKYVPVGINLGLGLYITKEIVSAHSGNIHVTSSDKEGTTFTAWFPRTIHSCLKNTQHSAEILDMKDRVLSVF